MANVTVSNLGGFVALFLMYIAITPIINKGLEILLPMLGPTESLIARAIPWAIGLGILTVLWDDEEPTRVPRR